MINKYNYKTAVLNEAGNSLKQTTIVESWLLLCEQPRETSNREEFSVLLDILLREKMTNGSTNELTRGYEADMRQTAHLLLIEKYLTGNSELMKATIAKDDLEIKNQISRSVSAALKAAKREFQRMMIRQNSVMEARASIDDIAGYCIHPSQRTHLWQLPYDAQRQLVSVALSRAITNKLIRRASGELATQLVEQEVSQAEMGRQLNLSRQVVHQRLTPARKFLQAAIEKQEFPLS